MDATQTVPLYRLPHDASVTAVDETTVRIGVAGAAVLLEGEAEHIVAAAHQLAEGVPVAHAPPVLEDLWSHGVLHRDDPKSGRQRLARLGMACVLVDGLDGGGGAQMADLLASRGLGTVVLHDPDHVTELDLTGLYHRRHLGRIRAEALREILTGRQQRSVVIECPPEGHVAGADLQIVIRRTSGAPSPARLRGDPATERAQRLLPVMLGDQAAVIGPIIDPGTTLCLPCLEHHSGTSAARRLAEPTSPGGVPEPLMTQVCAGIVAQQTVIMLTAEHQPALADSVMRVDAVTGHITSHPVAARPECDCGTQDSGFFPGLSPVPPSSSPELASGPS